MQDDVELLVAWREGDEVAGNLLFRRHFDAVYWFFRSKVADQAEDLTQDTWHAIVRNRDSLAEVRSFRAYLFTAARSKLYDALRARQRHGELDPLSQSLEDLGISPSEILGRHREQQLLVQALRKLPIEQQLLLELRYFEQMRGPELAAVLELPEATVRSRLRRALDKLRVVVEQLSDEPGLVHSTLTDLTRWAQELRQPDVVTP